MNSIGGDALSTPRSSLLTRRDVLEYGAKTALGLSLSSAVACSWTADQRSFFVDNVFRWEPADVLKDLAFAIIPSPQDQTIDYLDARCHHCGIAFRAFLYGVSLGYRFAVTCPACPPQLRLAVVVSRALISGLRQYAIKRAIGLAMGNGYRVHRVGPAGSVAVARSAACYDIREREPQRRFDRELPAVPARIFYFTEVEGVHGSTGIVHTWRKDGELTDRISLDVRSTKWRTWTFKQNLAPGTWILTTEMHDGAVLDVREFHIS